MPGKARALLHARIVWELIRYDLLLACRGLKDVRPRYKRLPAPRVGNAERESAICLLYTSDAADE